MTDNKPAQPQRRLSFVDDQSQSNSDINKAKLAQNVQQLNPQAVDRRQSIWQGQRRSVNNRRQSFSLSQGSRKSSQDITYPRIRLQNTYRIEPNENEKFKPYKIEPKLYSLLEDSLKNKVYDPKKSETLSKELSQDIMRETRLLMNSCSPRYKIISHVLIGEVKNQDIRYGSRCLWDNNLDNVASVVYKNSSLYAVATVFAVYYE